MNPNSFIATTDYATLKNDSSPVLLTLDIPGGVSFGPGTTVQFSNSVAVGTAGAPMNLRMNYSADSRWWVATDQVQVVEIAKDYQGYIYVYRSSPSVLTMLATFYNTGGGSTTTTARTASVSVRTYQPPFA